jgi:hypothetical protein
MLVSIPDAVAGEADGAVDRQTHCPTSNRGDDSISTSCDNRYSGNHMGEVPPSFEPHSGLTKFGNKTTLKSDPETAPNGVDFWWDEATANTGNCWFNNSGPDGTRDSLTADPPIAPAPQTSPPGFLPENCATSVGSLNYAAKVPVLLACYGQWETGELEAPSCTWYDTPPKPGSAEAKQGQAEQLRMERQAGDGDAGARITEWVEELAGEISYGPQG